jgi:O-acetyl-ADP-ribose deacetylase (regulator of RNase III)
VGELVSCETEGIVCPVRSDGAPMTAAARDLLREAGPGVMERLERMGALPVGSAFLTPSGSLTADFLIFVVTASVDEAESSLSVQRALRNGLRRAAEWGLLSLAVPALGIGVGHLEPEEDARAEVEILMNHLEEGQPPLELTLLVASAYEKDMFARLVDVLGRERFPSGN